MSREGLRPIGGPETTIRDCDVSGACRRHGGEGEGRKASLGRWMETIGSVSVVSCVPGVLNPLVAWDGKEQPEQANIPTRAAPDAPS